MLSRFVIRSRSAVLCALMTAMGLSVAALSAQTQGGMVTGLQPVRQADRIASNPDYSSLASLHEGLPGWVRVENQTPGQGVDLGATVHVALVLSRDAAAEAALEQLLANQQNPASPFYHQWLTPQQVGQLFGPTPNDMSAVSAWLTSQGLTIDSIAPSGVIIRASGTMAMVGGAFHTSFGMFGVGNRQRLSVVSEPPIPAVLSPVIRSVHGLTQAQYEPQSKFSVRTIPAAGTRPQTNLGNGVNAILPNDFAVIYDIASVYSGGDKGATVGSKAQHIAIIGKSRVVASDISNYESLAGLPNIQPNVVLAGTDPGVASGTNSG